MCLRRCRHLCYFLQRAVYGELVIVCVLTLFIHIFFWNRKIVSSLVANNMHEVLLHNDQLSWNMSKGLVLQNFTGECVAMLFCC